MQAIRDAPTKAVGAIQQAGGFSQRICFAQTLVHPQRLGNLIADLSADEGGFIAGVARVLDRERAKYKKPLDGAVIVTLGANGRLSITDPSTGWSADLMGFGADNAKAFAKLLAQNPKGN